MDNLQHKMSPFSIDLVNGLQGDPLVFVENIVGGDAVLLDAGSMESLGGRRILKANAVLVTHAHMDHFMGLDRFIRCHIPHRRKPIVVGPDNIHTMVACRLKSYLWNLLDQGQLVYKVIEVTGSGIRRCYELSCDNQFEPRLIDEEVFDTFTSVLKMQGGTEVKATVLNHGTPVLGYSMKSPNTCKFLLDNNLGLKPGPWISEVQKKYFGRDIDEMIEVNNKSWKIEELLDNCFKNLPGTEICYLTDFEFSRANLKNIVVMSSGAEAIICESSFKAEDRSKAKKYKHLTTKQAALIAALLRCKKLVNFHISNIYREPGDGVWQECQSEFSRLSKLSNDSLELEILHELNLINTDKPSKP